MTGESGSDAAVPEVPLRPVLRIVSGNPTPEETAAVIAVLSAAAAGGSDEAEPEPLAPWSQPASMFRAPMPVPGPYAWTQSVR